MMDASQLLRAWCEQGSEAAFRELVAHYADLVYSVARRVVGGDAHLADDVVQKVFVDLAIQARQKRGPLAKSTCALGGWLHRHTLFVGANMRRREERRRVREETAAKMNSLEKSGESAWEQLAPILDETLNELDPADREALILRFYERRDLRSVGAVLGVSEDAAQKRIARAIVRLRDLIVSRGVVLSVVTVTSLLGERAVEAAPPTLAARVAQEAVMAGTGVGTGFLGYILTEAKVKVAVGLVLSGFVAVPLLWHFVRSSSPVADAANEARIIAAGPTAGMATGMTDNQIDAQGVAINTALVADEVPYTLRLTILSSQTGEPVPDVIVHCSWYGGGFSGQKKLSSTFDGICEVPIPPNNTQSFWLRTECDGFADTTLLWHPGLGEAVPSDYTVRLERAVPIGGTVVDPNGKAVIGAKVLLGQSGYSIWKSRRESHDFGSIQVKTDSKGRWRVSRIAGDMIRRVSCRAEHPDFLQSETVNVDQDPAFEALLLAGQCVLQLRHGVTIRGVVLNNRGEPISGATVSVGMLIESTRKTTSSAADGTFILGGCEPGIRPLTATATGYAPNAIETEISENTPPMQFVLQKGKALRFRVVDTASRPIANALFGLNTDDFLLGLVGSMGRVMPQIEFHGLTDAEGRGLWESAPNCEVEFFFVKSGYIQRQDVRMRPSDEEYVVVLQPALTISGTVTDAITRRPVPRFRITCGWPEAAGNEQRVRWSSTDRFNLAFVGGTFRHTIEEPLILGIPNPGYVFKFEADGYAPFVTRVFAPEEGEVEFSVALEAAALLMVTVLQPDGMPAAGCNVGMLGPDTILTLFPGGLASIGSDSSVLTADDAGQFQLPVDTSVTKIVAAHPQGFVIVSPQSLRSNPVLRLQDWARVAGTLRSRGEPARGRELTVSFLDGGFPSAIRFADDGYRVVTDEQGGFVFERVPSGDLMLVELKPLGITFKAPGVGQSWVHEPLRRIQTPPGQTTFVEAND